VQRLNFTFDASTAELLETLANTYYGGNKSQTVRAALESLAAHTRHMGWVIAGYTTVVLDRPEACHTCGGRHRKGELVYRPVFERGSGAAALEALPRQPWFECPRCVEAGSVTHA